MEPKQHKDSKGGAYWFKTHPLLTVHPPSLEKRQPDWGPFPPSPLIPKFGLYSKFECIRCCLPKSPGWFRRKTSSQLVELEPNKSSCWEELPFRGTLDCGCHVNLLESKIGIQSTLRSERLKLCRGGLASWRSVLDQLVQCPLTVDQVSALCFNISKPKLGRVVKIRHPFKRLIRFWLPSKPSRRGSLLLETPIVKLLASRRVFGGEWGSCVHSPHKYLDLYMFFVLHFDSFLGFVR